MISLSLGKYEETQVVHLPVRMDQGYANQSGYFPPAGWTVVALWCEAFDEERYSNGGSFPLRRTRTCVLLGRTLDVALVEAKAVNDELRTQYEEADKVTKQLREELNQAKVELAKEAALSERMQKRAETLVAERGDEKIRFQQMERDLGKLREVLGRKQIDSILLDVKS